MEILHKFSKLALRCGVNSRVTKRSWSKFVVNYLTVIIRNSSNIIDSKNPYNVDIKARYKRTFAYKSMSSRFPEKIKRLIKQLDSDRESIIHEYGDKADDEINTIMRNLEQLRCDVILDKKFQLFKRSSPDQHIWNASLCEVGNKNNTYFTAVWCFAQCYAYRRIREIFEEQSLLQYYDYYRKQKELALTSQYTPMKMIANHIERHRNVLKAHPEKLEKYFYNLIKLDLWGNQFDLSISEGVQEKAFDDPFHTAIQFDKSILVNNIENIWKSLSDPSVNRSTTIVSFVCDNAGYELFTDFCIGDFLLENCLAKSVRFHVKLVPFFISDTMPDDFLWTLCKLRTHNDENLSKFGRRCSDYLQDGRFKLMDNEYFWTTGYSFNRMQDVDSAMYKTLGDAQLVIIKGDMNYRKLLGEVNWSPTTPFVDALQGFRPSNLCSLRTVKSELICGLKPGQAEELQKRNPKWLTTGEYGLIHYIGKNN